MRVGSPISKITYLAALVPGSSLQPHLGGLLNRHEVAHNIRMGKGRGPAFANLIH